MRAAKLTERPDFALMRQNDVRSFYHLQMPRWLFAEAKYAELSLEAKVAYTFLLNRFQLSRLKGWSNDQGEVFIIFTREALAAEMRVSYKKAIACFKELAQAGLIWEKRCGRGFANQIYLAKIETPEVDDPVDSSYECAPFIAPEKQAEGENGSLRTAETAGLENPATPAFSARPAESAYQELPMQQVKNCQDSGSRTAGGAYPDMPLLPASKKEKTNIKKSNSNVSHSVRLIGAPDAEQDDAELEEILAACGLEDFAPEVAKVLHNAIERLFYSESFRVGNAVLPQRRVRNKLHLLNWMVLQDAEGKLRENREQVKNATAYTMSVVFNCICELENDLLLDPYLNELHALPPLSPEGGG